MNELHSRPKLRSYAAIMRRREARRRRYMRRRIGALIILGLLGGLLYYGGRSGIAWVVEWRAASAEPQTEVPKIEMPFTAEVYLNGADLDGDGSVERIAISKADDGLRQVALTTGSGSLIGAPLTLSDFPISLKDLPRAAQVLVWEGRLPGSGEPEEVPVGDATAMKAAGGEPSYQAWRMDASQGLVPVDYYALLAPLTPPEPTVIIVDKGLNLLWYYEDGELIQTARVATGEHISGPAPSAANQKVNYLTPEGHYAVSVALPGVKYWAEDIPAGDPRNPLGTRWLGFNAFDGDTGHIWAIHGTNDPDGRLGRWVTHGTVEMRNEEIEALYERVQVGTPIVIQKTES